MVATSAEDGAAIRGSSRSIEHELLSVRKARLAMAPLLYNLSALYQLRCDDAEDKPLIRVGYNNFRTDPRDVCQLFTGNTNDDVGPQSMFELIYFHSTGSYGLKSLMNNFYVQAVPPPQDNPTLPWKLTIGGPVPGTYERFRFTRDGYLYSPIIGGMFQCGAGQMVKGYSGKYGNYNHFKLEKLSEEDYLLAHKSVILSDTIISQQQSQLELFKSKVNAASKDPLVGIPTVDGKKVRISLCIPVTSKGTVMSSVTDSPLWSNLFDTFMKSIDWRANKYIFRFYIGFDKADLLYDTGDSWSEMREEFKNRAIYRMKEQLMGDTAIATVLENHLSLKLMHFEHLTGAPSQVVSQLVLQAYMDDFDYFYQVNDDTIIITSNWAPRFVDALANNFIPNFGVTGPLDTNNDKIFTHAFVSRVHVEIFGHLFPPYFKNWWSDDWISTVYGTENTMRLVDVEIKHNVGAQKQGGYTRYDVDKSAELHLEDELRKGHKQIDAWLVKNNYPRLPLPNLCGYVPIANKVVQFLEDTKA